MKILGFSRWKITPVLFKVEQAVSLDGLLCSSCRLNNGHIALSRPICIFLNWATFLVALTERSMG